MNPFYSSAEAYSEKKMPCTINLKLSSMATNNCFISHPPLFATTKLSKSYSLKPFNNKLHLSCSSSCSSSLPFILSLTNKKPHYFKTSVSVLSTDEENTLVLDGQEQDFNFDNDQEGEFQEPSEDAKVFVGNLPLDIDSAALAGIFEKAGFVEMAEVIYNRETDRSRGFAFVTMSTVEEAEKAVEMFNRYDIKGGKLLTVTKALRRGEAVERPPRTFEPSYKIYVGNLPYSVDEARLEQLFSEHGQVVNVKVLYDRETGQSRGFGFVTMASEAEMVNTIANLDGQNLEGRSIRVNAAEDKRD